MAIEHIHRAHLVPGAAETLAGFVRGEVIECGIARPGTLDEAQAGRELGHLCFQVDAISSLTLAASSAVVGGLELVGALTHLAMYGGNPRWSSSIDAINDNAGSCIDADLQAICKAWLVSEGCAEECVQVKSLGAALETQWPPHSLQPDRYSYRYEYGGGTLGTSTDRIWILVLVRIIKYSYAWRYATRACPGTTCRDLLDG